MPLTRSGNIAAVGCHKFSGGIVCLMTDGSFISLIYDIPRTEASHEWNENAVHKHSEGFACPAEFLS